VAALIAKAIKYKIRGLGPLAASNALTKEAVALNYTKNLKEVGQQLQVAPAGGTSSLLRLSLM
jgi:hypothetical protein